MTALAAATERKHKHAQNIVSYKVAASTVIHKGALVCINASGYAIPGADTAGIKFVGVATETVDNSSGSNGTLSVRVAKEYLGKFAKSGSITIANLGTEVTIVDDNTVALAATTTNDIPAGLISAVDDDGELWIDTRLRAL